MIVEMGMKIYVHLSVKSFSKHLENNLKNIHKACALLKTIQGFHTHLHTHTYILSCTKCSFHPVQMKGISKAAHMYARWAILCFIQRIRDVFIICVGHLDYAWPGWILPSLNIAWFVDIYFALGFHCYKQCNSNLSIYLQKKNVTCMLWISPDLTPPNLHKKKLTYISLVIDFIFIDSFYLKPNLKIKISSEWPSFNWVFKKIK